MIPQPIEFAKIDKKELSRHDSGSKRPTGYQKSKNKLPDELHEGSLEVIKQFIANNQLATFEIDVKLDPSTQVGALYDKLLQAIVVAHANGVQETTFFLDGNAFSSSVFHGAKITITEYSTAPKVFNIDFSAHSKAVALFQSHAAELLIALQKKELGFSVNRIDSSLLAEEERIAIQKVEREDDV